MTTTAEPLRVLVVEDDPGDACLLALLLAESERPSLHAIRAATLAEALALVEGADVVLLDLSLPDSSGEATVQRMREAAPDLPIVIMSGFDDPDFAERMVGLGSQDYLVKGEATGPLVARAIRYAITRMQHAIEREALVRELQAAVEMKNRAFGVLAHDLRNPLGAIGGYAEFLQMTEGGNLSERAQGALRTIEDAVRYMDGLIEGVLSLAVVDAGAVQLVRQSFDLAAAVRRAMALCAGPAEKKGVQLAADVVPGRMDGDSIKIKQVLGNLVANAVKFSHPGGEVRVSARVEDGEARITVADQGVGISPAVMAGLFKPFVKGETGTAGERSNGLGLYICARVVEAHGGRIAVDSEAGRGTTITVVLPAP